MNAAISKAMPFPNFRFISSVFVSVLVAACTNNGSSYTQAVEIGDSVVLREYAIACKQPSEDLSRIAISNGKHLRDLEEKFSHIEGCYDASRFEKGGWEVLAINGTQLLIKMPNYAGQYWVSSARVRRGEPEVFKAQNDQSTASR